MSHAPFAVVFRIDLRHGRCVAVALPTAREGDATAVPADVLALLPDQEQEHARGLGPARRITWVGGRLALRAALSDLGITAGALLTDPSGAPRLPEGTMGSISHKAHLAVALASADAGWSLGIDLEDPAALRRDVSSYVLGDKERQEIAALDQPQRATEVLVRFAAKEALYKALHPLLRRHISFQEAVVMRDQAKALRASLTLRGDEGPFEVEVREAHRDGLILVTARARRGDPSP